MIGRYLGKHQIVNLMCQHSVVRKKSGFVRRLFSIIGPMAIKLVGYPFDNWTQERAREVIRDLQPVEGDRILDFGCGIGYYAMEFALNYGCTCVGLDIDAEDVALANKIKDVLKLENVAFLTEIDHENHKGHFDKIVASEVLEHIEDDKRTIQRLANLLKPDGKLVVTVPFASEPQEYDKPNPKYWNHVRNGYSLDSFKEKLVGTELDIDAWRVCCDGKCLLLVMKAKSAG